MNGKLTKTKLKKVTIDVEIRTDDTAEEYYREKNRLRQAEYAKKNPQRVRDNVKRWKEQNPEKQKKYAEKWRKANPDKHREASLRYYYANREAILEKKKEAYTIKRKNGDSPSYQKNITKN